MKALNPLLWLLLILYLLNVGTLFNYISWLNNEVKEKSVALGNQIWKRTWKLWKEIQTIGWVDETDEENQDEQFQLMVETTLSFFRDKSIESDVLINLTNR